MDKNFYDYQKNRFGLLLGWGAFNTLSGTLIGLTSYDKFWRSIGFMNAGWGFINALLAIGGRSGATKNARRYPDDQQVARREAGKMRRLLLINAPLDVLYVVSGWWLTRQKEADKRGWGASIIVQGAWLFVYDSLLAREVGKRWK